MKKKQSQFPFRLALVLAFLVFGLSAVMVYGAGFISFENGNTVVMWDGVQVLGGGILVADAVSQGIEMPAAGNMVVSGRDINVRGAVGFCPTYTNTLERCTTLLGDIGDGKALKVKSISNSQQLTIQGTNKNGISIFSGSPNGTVEISGTLNNAGGNIVSTKDYQGLTSANKDSAIADTVQTNSLQNGTALLNLGGPSGVAIGSDVFDVSKSANKLFFSK